MVTLTTVRRVLALDLGLSPAAIEQCVAEAGPAAGDAIPLATALQIVERAEALCAA